MASASRCKSAVPKDVIDQFCAITDATAEIADRLLEACNGNLEMAIGMHMDGADGVSQVPIPTHAPGSPLSACGSGSATADALDDVRAPIPQRREVLVQDVQANFSGIGNFGVRRTPRSVFDGLRDFQAEARQQQEATQIDVPKSQKQKTLEDLFRPPIDLMFKGSFHAARDKGTASNRWLLVNVQNAKEFQCQMLNRDVWSNASVKSLINDSFVFWQVYNDSEEGRKYMQFYKIQTWPYIAILDPQTGENLVTWNNVDAITLCDLMTEYLAEHHRPDGMVSLDGPPAKRARKDSIIEASEDSQLQAAIQASMKENTPKRSPNPIVIDSDDDDYGSDADLETFSDSGDEPVVPVKKSTAEIIDSNTNSSSRSGCHSAAGNGDAVDGEGDIMGDVQLVSESSLSSSSSGIAPATLKSPSTQSTSFSSNMPTASITTSSFSATASTSSASSYKQTDQQNHTSESSNISTTLASSSCVVSAGSSSSSAESIDCVNGSSGDPITGPTNRGPNSGSSSSTNGTEASDSQNTGPPKKFQFVQQSTAAVSLSSWRDHLGSDSDLQTVINIRFPDGNRQQFKVPCSTKLRALIMFVQEEGYHKEMYELVTNFPKRKLSYLDIEDTLRNHGLFPQETVFVQER